MITFSNRSYLCVVGLFKGSTTFSQIVKKVPETEKGWEPVLYWNIAFL